MHRLDYAFVDRVKRVGNSKVVSKPAHYKIKSIESAVVLLK